MKASWPMKNKKKHRSVRRISTQRRTDTSTDGAAPENRTSQVVPLLERSGVPIANSTPTNIDLQRVPEDLEVTIDIPTEHLVCIRCVYTWS